MSTSVNRRNLIKQVLTGSAAIATGVVVPSTILAAVKNNTITEPLKGNIQHSACRWCYDSIPTTTLAKNFKQLGMVGMDLVGPSEWKILKENNLISTMCNGAEISLTEGFNTVQ